MPAGIGALELDDIVRQYEPSRSESQGETMLRCIYTVPATHVAILRPTFGLLQGGQRVWGRVVGRGQGSGPGSVEFVNAV